MLLRLAPAAALLSLLSMVQAGTFDRPVINLDAKTFDKEVLQDDVRSTSRLAKSPTSLLANALTIAPNYARKCRWSSSTPLGELGNQAASFGPACRRTDIPSALPAFTPRCGHCKNLGPEFQKAAGSLAPIVPFYAVDCDEVRQ